jgi:predicted GNAT family N-acyltransferase
VSTGAQADREGGAAGSSGSPRVELRVGDWPTLREDAALVRRAVFIAEQGIPEAEEWDEHDPASVHAVAYVDGRPAGTGRLLPDARIGRMAVLAEHRRAGLASLVLARLVEIAHERGERELHLSAQAYVRELYARHGFVEYGPVYDDAGIPHQMMRRRLR